MSTCHKSESPEYRASSKECPDCLDSCGKAHPNSGLHLQVTTQIKRKSHPTFSGLASLLLQSKLPCYCCCCGWGFPCWQQNQHFRTFIVNQDQGYPGTFSASSARLGLLRHLAFWSEKLWVMFSLCVPILPSLMKDSHSATILTDEATTECLIFRCDSATVTILKLTS